MNIDIYATHKTDAFIAVATGQPIPDKVRAMLKHPSHPVKTIEVARGKPLIALNPNQVLDDIDKDGFAVFGSSVGMTETL